ncbi:MBL fold metallo-hydrolase [Myxococcota bacterium]|jgi:phosphoribosyl 1,2-cyclic phosphodiesterase|nr:MBL fold metallo-hydrolase [Myxococcota bacterium]
MSTDHHLEPAIQVRFWGVRGSIATPGPTTVRYGGNTPCLEVRAGQRLIILDCGTGLRGLGNALMAERRPIDADIFFSHMHWDHIQGFPFFTPAFIPGNAFRIYGQNKGEQTVRAVLEGQMTDPNFPVPLSIMRSTLSFHAIVAGDVVELGDVRVVTTPLNHPGGCLGIRIEHAGGAFVYATDTEHDPSGSTLDERLVALAQGADALVYDAMYTDEEYLRGKIGWGHSTYSEALRIARAARVRRLYLFHHDPTHDDDYLDNRLAEARADAGDDPALDVEMAREGERVVIRGRGT